MKSQPAISKEIFNQLFTPGVTPNCYLRRGEKKKKNLEARFMLAKAP
jgi:hypothetical protein